MGPGRFIGLVVLFALVVLLVDLQFSILSDGPLQGRVVASAGVAFAVLCFGAYGWWQRRRAARSQTSDQEGKPGGDKGRP